MYGTKDPFSFPAEILQLKIQQAIGSFVLPFFLLGNILLMVYISLALRSVHRFDWG
jgi:hypothetical protein